MLEVGGLAVARGGIPILHGVNFCAEAGEVLAVVGRNGAGKSTLLETISGFHKATAGTIRLDGVSISGLGPSALGAQGIALVPQGKRLFRSLNVERNLLLSAPAAKGKKKQAGLYSVEAVLDQLPVLAARRKVTASKLSGGEQELLAISRALVRPMKMILLDEPTEGLAVAAVKWLAGVIVGLKAAGIIVLIAEQRLAFVEKVADRCILLEKGRVTEEVAAGEVQSGLGRFRDAVVL